jgi:hypothetical protein
LQSRAAVKGRGRVALVPAESAGPAGPAVDAVTHAPFAPPLGGVSPLLVSVPARLALVAIVVSLLWLAVLWALA